MGNWEWVIGNGELRKSSKILILSEREILKKQIFRRAKNEKLREKVASLKIQSKLKT
jgi:hypothetical protein